MHCPYVEIALTPTKMALHAGNIRFNLAAPFTPSAGIELHAAVNRGKHDIQHNTEGNDLPRHRQEAGKVEYRLINHHQRLEKKHIQEAHHSATSSPGFLEGLLFVAAASVL